MNTKEITEQLTIRDYFAAKVMEGTFANPEATDYMSNLYGNDLPTAFGRIAKKSYQMADAMLKERSKTDKTE